MDESEKKVKKAAIDRLMGRIMPMVTISIGTISTKKKKEEKDGLHDNRASDKD
jgi:hypothetical protein